MLELAILGLLEEEGPLHGYELRKRLSTDLGLWLVSFGSLYPALARLERATAIEVDPEGGGAPLARVAMPPTGSISGEAAAARLRRAGKTTRRTRKGYRITPGGKQLLRRLLVADDGAGADETRAFALKLAFCRFLSIDDRLTLLQRRRARIIEKLATARGYLARAGGGGPSGPRTNLYTRYLMEHETSSVERELDWVDELIAAERQGGTSR